MKYSTLILFLLLLSFNVFPKENIETELINLTNQLSRIEKQTKNPSLKKLNFILNGRQAPYAIIYEHTGLFQWQLFSECYHDWSVDTTTYINVDVDYKPNDDLFSTIPAYFYFTSKRPYPSLSAYKSLMTSVFQAVGTNVSVLLNETDSKYGYTGHHYCQSFYSGTTKLVLDCYFVYIDNVACAIYYMTGDSYYDNFLYQIFFNLIMNVLEFKEPTNLSINDYHVPIRFNLSQNYPNPFNSATTINYSVSTPTNIKLELFDIQGRLIDTLIDSHHKSGEYHFDYNANDIASGMYIYRLSNSQNYKTHRMILIK